LADILPLPMEPWQQVDDHLTELFGLEDDALRAALDATVAAGLPQIQVSAVLGRFLQLQARAIGARRILEIGTLAGYSTIWMARALPADGRLITLELDPHHADVARSNLARAGLDGVAEVRVGPALASLAALVDEDAASFDLIFIDADKETYPDYLDWSLRLAHPGTLIIADNVVRGGQIVDASSPDARVQGIRRFNAQLAADKRLLAGIVQTVGSKGHDGMALALVLEG
jgi:predicted O-methyltransferase YrrM